MFVINALLGFDVPIEMWIVSVNMKDCGKQTWHWASPHWKSNISLAPCGSYTLTFALVIVAIVETLTRVLSSATLET